MKEIFREFSKGLCLSLLVSCLLTGSAKGQQFFRLGEVKKSLTYDWVEDTKVRKVWRKGEWLRTEIGREIILYNTVENVIYEYSPSENKVTKTRPGLTEALIFAAFGEEEPSEAIKEIEKELKKLKTKFLRTETVEGKVCDVYLLYHPEKLGREIKRWVWKKYGLIIREEANGEEVGYATNIKIEKLPDELFTLPKDIEIVDVAKVIAETFETKKLIEALAMQGKSAIPSLIKYLKDKNPNVRKSTARALGKIKDKSAIPALIEALKDENARVRNSAAYALETIGDESVIPALIEALKDEDAGVLAQALVAMPNKSAVPTLLELLENRDQWVRLLAARALGKIGDKSSVPALIKVLKDEDSDVRGHAIWALREIGDPRAIPALEEALKTEKDAFVRKIIVNAIQQIKARQK